MTNYRQNSNKMMLIQLGIFLAVIAVIYGGDLLLYNLLNGEPFSLVAYNALSTYALLFVCVLILLGYYIYDLVKKIKEKRLPKNFFSVWHIILKVLALFGVTLASILFITNLTAVIRDSKTEPQQLEYTVNEVVADTGKAVVFKVMEDDKEVVVTANYIKGITVTKKKDYKLYYYKNLKVYVIVEDLSDFV